MGDNFRVSHALLENAILLIKMAKCTNTKSWECVYVYIAEVSTTQEAYVYHTNLGTEWFVKHVSLYDDSVLF